MQTNPKLEQLLTTEVTRAASIYFVARSHAELKREAVDQVHRAILAERTLMATLCTTGDLKETHPHYTDTPSRIADPANLFLCQDEAALAEYYAESHRREVALKLKPPEMPINHCPALIAENLQVEAENLLLDLTCPAFNIAREILYGDNREKFLDLLLRILVNHPKTRDRFTAKKQLDPYFKKKAA